MRITPSTASAEDGTNSNATTASNVTIDLNGFSIFGPHQCAASVSCAPGVGAAIGHGIVAGTD